MGVPMYPQAIRRQVRALTSVSHCFYTLLLPSAYLRMVLGYTHVFIHTNPHTNSELHVRVMPCSVCVELLVLLSLINKPIDMFIYTVCHCLSYTVGSLFFE